MKLKKIISLALIATMLGTLSVGKVAIAKEKVIQEDTKELTIDTIEEKIENMTIEEKLGQTIMIAPRMWNNETVTGKNEEIEAFIKKYNIGGVALFENNFSNGSKGVVEFIDGLQKASDIPLFVSIDQEGGAATRVSDGTRMVGNMALGAANDEKLTEEVYEAMGKEIKSIGVNIDLAPVSEIAEDPLNTVIGLRSFGSDKENVGKMVKASIKGLHNSGTMAAIKHFPGQASVSEDTHFKMTIIPESKEKVKNDYMYAFKEGIYAGADFVMPTHAVIPSLDNSTIIDKNNKEIPTPTTFSKTILTDILRNELGFNGVVITDAMDMEGITEGFDDYQISEKALNAGCDILLMPYMVAGMQTNYKTGKLEDTVKGFDEYFSKLVEYVRNGTIKEERLNEAVRRILTLKVKNNLYKDNKVSLEEKLSNVDKVVGSKENKEIEKKAAEKAVTLVKNDNNILPMKLENNKKVVIYDYAVAYEDEDGQEQISTTLSADRIKEAVEKVAKDEGIKNLNVQIAPIDLKVTILDYNTFENNVEFNRSIDEMCKDMDDADYVIIAPYMQIANFAELPKPWYAKCDILPEYNIIPEKLIDYANKNKKNYVSLNVREPYGISYMNNSKAIVSIYTNLGGDMASSFDPNLNLYNVEAGVRTIFGYNKPQGKLPVDIKKELDGKVIYPVGHGLTY